jgi:hypothetical protein
VEYNEVARCLGQLSDGAAINVSGAGRGNVVRRNYVHDIIGGPGEEPTACLRTDDCQWGTLFEENVIANSSVRAMEHKCENDVINNVIVNVRPDGVMSTLDQWGPFGKSRLERNIFVACGDQPAWFYRVFKPADYARFAGTGIDRNIYFNAYAPNAPGRDFTALRAQGLEANSLLADPGLVDWRNGDYRLRSDSPAHQLGIKSLDVRGWGLRR